MIKTILVPAAGSAADPRVFASALAVARPFSAHLEFLHVRVDAASMAVTMSSEGGGATMVGGLVERLDEEAERREMRARRLFDEFCAREGVAITDTPPGPAAPSAQWTRQIGPEPYWVVEHGRAADLMVMGRAADGEGVAPETIETALLDSGRPVLHPACIPDDGAAANRRHRLEGDARGGACGDRGPAVSRAGQGDSHPDRRRGRRSVERRGQPIDDQPALARIAGCGRDGCSRISTTRRIR